MVDKNLNEAMKERVVAATKKARAEAVRLYTETDLTTEEIGARYGVSRQTVHRWITAAGVPLRGPMGPRNREPEEAQLPADGLPAVLGRLMDAIDELRRELSAHQAYVHAQVEFTQRQLEALTQGLNMMQGAQTVHAQSVTEFMTWARDIVARKP